MPGLIFPSGRAECPAGKTNSNTGPSPRAALGGRRGARAWLKPCATEVTKRCAQDIGWFGVERSMVLWYGLCVCGETTA